jgi:hypothetical protein
MEHNNIKRAPKVNKIRGRMQFALLSMLALWVVWWLTSCDWNKTEKDKIYDAYSKIEQTYRKAQKNTISEKTDVEKTKLKLIDEEQEAKDAAQFEAEMKILLEKAELARRNSDSEAIARLADEIEILKKMYNQ